MQRPDSPRAVGRNSVRARSDARRQTPDAKRDARSSASLQASNLKPQTVLTSEISLVSVALASPNSIEVLGA
jgi:hypothetical protein